MPITPLIPPSTSAAVQVPVLAPAVAQPIEVAPAADVKDARMHPDDQALEQALREINDNLRGWSTSLRFEVDSDTSRVLVRVIDTETGDVIRQIPSEEVLNMSKELGKLQDLAFRASA